MAAAWVIGSSAWVPQACAAEAPEAVLTDEHMTVRVEANHHLLLPQDWPIQQKDGQLGPVPVEAYLSMKFGQVRGKFEAGEGRVAALEERVRMLEAERQTIIIRVKTLEEQVAQRQGVTDGHQAQDR